MRRELHAEWTKLRTLPSTGPLLVAIVALTVAVSAAVAAAVAAGGVAAAGAARCPAAGCGYDAARVGLSGVQAGQAVVAVLAIVAITGEYGTGMIRVTLAAMPRRTAVLAAKAAVVAGLTAAAGAVAVLSSALAGRLILPDGGGTAGLGHPPLSLADGPTLRAVFGSVLYLTLITLLGLGVAAAVRDPAASIGAVLGLLYLMPVIAAMIPDVDWQRRVWEIAPMSAGLAVQATTDLAGLPLGPWAGLGVLAAWAAAALLGGGILLRLRDA